MKALLCPAGLAALRTAWLALLVSSALAATVGVATHRQRSAERQNLATSRHLLAQAETHLAQARRDDEGLEQWLATYRHLTARGGLGPEDRLGLVEHLTHLKAVHRLGTLDFALEPQREVSFAEGPTPSLRLLASHLTLTIRATHEGHALAFLAAVSAPPQGVLVTQSCNLRRLPAAAPSPAAEAVCAFEWLTAHPRETVQRAR